MDRRLRPEEWSALVNGLLVLCVPSLLFGALTLSAANHPVLLEPVHPPGGSPWPGAILAVLRGAIAMIPYALVAAWRTWAHARRWQSGDRGWLGIAEAGVCGFAAVVVGGLLHTTHSLAQALPYFTFYGLFGFVAALPIGVVLFLTARVVLRVTANSGG
jgi:hypothetical protein